MTTLHLTLRDEDREFLERAMKSGRYATESEIVSDAIAELRTREELRESRLGEIRRQVMIGVEQLDAGEGAEWSLEEVKARGQELLAGRKKE
jgi:Arc/MetJ-type ribon-helix-helix transcriptional regulator